MALERQIIDRETGEVKSRGSLEKIQILLCYLEIK